MSKLNNELNKLGLDINTIDDNILIDILEQLKINKKTESNNILHDSAYKLAITYIPDMLITNKMIIINGYINNLPLKILLDTGSSGSIICNHTIKYLKLEYLIDFRTKTILQGICKEKSIGRIWYIELKLNDNIFPISLIGSNIITTKFDIILGINFFQTYNAIFNFKDKILILNNKYNINFDHQI